MMTIKAMHTVDSNDAELVAESLEGNRDAFGRIVQRYQTLISSLAYCATGNLGRSEDLAQETFLAAWKQLGELREPAKLRPWLCSIVRFRISRDFRRQGRELISETESLEAADDSAAPEPLPLDRVIAEEEKAILWRSLERIPQIYREPLVLFYRENQSVEAVARDLGLSEDAVKQRLSRGRKLLQGQLLAFVAGALNETRPTRTFTLGVLGALPSVSTSAKAAAVAAVGKGSSAVPLAAGAKAGALSMNGPTALISLIGASGLVGRWAGRQMRRAGERSLGGRRRVVRFWWVLAVSFAVFVLPMVLVRSMNRSHHWLYHAASWSMAAFYGVIAVALVVWMWNSCRDARHPDQQPPGATGLGIRSYRKWVALGMLGPALILVKFVGGFATSLDTHTMRYHQTSQAEALKIIAEHRGGSDAAYFWRPDADARKIASERNNARFMVNQYQDGSRFLLIRRPASAGPILYTPWDDSLNAALVEKGIAYKVQLVGGAPLKGDVVFRYAGFGRLLSSLSEQGRRFLRIPTLSQIHHDDLRQWLVLLSTAIVAAASVLLTRRKRGTLLLTDSPVNPYPARR